jgi:SAM-dependent methyltransferase
MLATRAKNYIRAVRQYGLVASSVQYWNRLRERLCDRSLGIQSRDIISLSELGLEHEERRGHYPTSVDDFRRMAKFLRPRNADEVLLDYGSGLGRFVILAATMRFARIVGIELSPQLVEVARNNVSRCERSLACKDIEIVVADATSYDVPDNVTTIYFNNPFAGTILGNVLSRILASYKKSPRALRIVCNLPEECAFFDIMERADQFMLDARIDLGANRRCCAFSIKIP